MKVTEEHCIHITHHSNPGIMNALLMEDIDNVVWGWTNKTNIMGEMSDWNLMNDNIIMILEWVVEEITQNYDGFEKFTFHGVENWFARYGEGDYGKRHRHMTAPFSYVYFINTPPGSSPLVFPTSNTSIEAEAGKLVIFPGDMIHEVPPNQCENRCVLVGNLITTAEDMTIMHNSHLPIDVEAL